MLWFCLGLGSGFGVRVLVRGLGVRAWGRVLPSGLLPFLGLRV